MEKKLKSNSKKNRKLRIFLWIAGSLLAVLLVISLGIWLYIEHTLNVIRDKYTSATSMEIVPVKVTSSQKKACAKAYNSLRQAIAKGKSVEVKLKGEDFTPFIENVPELQRVKSCAQLGIDGENITAKMSMPLEFMEMKRFNGRYLNGDFIIDAKIENNNIQIKFKSIEASGNKVPDFMLDVINKVDWNSKLKQKLGLDWFNRIEYMKVVNGEFLIKTKEQ